MKFYKFLHENKKDNNVGIFILRGQPFHTGHYSIIKYMIKECSSGYVFIVEGKKSSQDKEKNPLSGKERVDIIKSFVASNIKVLVVDSAFLPVIFTETYPEELANIENKNVIIYGGADRDAGYRVIAQKLLKMGPNSVDFSKLDFDRESVSATIIRNFIRDGKFDVAQKYLPYNISKIKNKILNAKI